MNISKVIVFSLKSQTFSKIIAVLLILGGIIFVFLPTDYGIIRLYYYRLAVILTISGLSLLLFIILSNARRRTFIIIGTILSYTSATIYLFAILWLLYRSLWLLYNYGSPLSIVDTLHNRKLFDILIDFYVLFVIYILPILGFLAFLLVGLSAFKKLRRTKTLEAA